METKVTNIRCTCGCGILELEKCEYAGWDIARGREFSLYELYVGKEELSEFVEKAKSFIE